jgi:hypothetical protein
MQGFLLFEARPYSGACGEALELVHAEQVCEVDE